VTRSRGVRGSRPGTRTIFVAVSGLGSAALVTSISALSVGSDGTAVVVAVVGGTVVLGVAALITIVCALRMSKTDDQAAWAAIGVALALTTGASGLRAGQMLAGSSFIRAGVAEVTYIAGATLLLIALVGWPLRYRGSVRLATVAAEAVVATVAILGLAWTFVGRAILESAGEYGGIGPNQAAQFLAFLAVLGLGAVFTFVSAVNLRRVTPLGSWALLALAAALIVTGDAAWLADVTDASWMPGSLGDFVHIAGHVLVAVGASWHLDETQEAAQGVRSAAE